MRRSIIAEMALAFLVLGLVAAWGFTPRALASGPVAEVAVEAVEPLLVHMMDDTIMVMASVTPGQAGPVTLELAVSDFEGTPLLAQALEVTLSSPALAIEPIKREAVAGAEEGSWRVEGLTIPAAGEWALAVELRVGPSELRSFVETIAIP